MKSKKSPKPTKKDQNWQKKIEQRVEAEKVALNHPKGKEKFDHLLKRLLKGKSGK